MMRKNVAGEAKKIIMQEIRSELNKRRIKKLMESNKSVLNESDDTEKPRAYQDDEKKEFLESIRRFNEYGKSIYKTNGMKELYEKVRNIVEFASTNLSEEQGEWMDSVTTSRHSKRLKESFRVFEKTLQEVTKLQQRLEAAYDDIGETLNRYYEIDDDSKGTQDVKMHESVKKSSSSKQSKSKK
jgi:hypothetical protein